MLGHTYVTGGAGYIGWRRSPTHLLILAHLDNDDILLAERGIQFGDRASQGKFAVRRSCVTRKIRGPERMLFFQKDACHTALPTKATLDVFNNAPHLVVDPSGRHWKSILSEQKLMCRKSLLGFAP